MQISACISVSFLDTSQRWVVRGGVAGNVKVPDAYYCDEIRALHCAILRAALMRFPPDNRLSIGEVVRRERLAKINGSELELALGDSKLYLLADDEPIAEILASGNLANVDIWRSAARNVAEHIGSRYIGDIEYITTVRNFRNQMLQLYRAGNKMMAVEVVHNGEMLVYLGNIKYIMLFGGLSSKIRY